ncbi:MAG: hypothetical protein QOD98_4214 [Nocardioidaceae bacterium]|nr:hypothetical protein [Nocardioidaceae bacterium]
MPRLLAERPADAPRQWGVEGTMAYLDISGFTTLSEQLAKRGRVGTEDLVSTLTRIFTLLMSASDDGGDVVKFAGDAMLILYEGPDHPAHAAHAASAIQKLLRVAGDVHLAGARARLSMSVGIHSGEFEFLLTGRDQQNLVVCGAALDAVMTAQGEANAGQILLTHETAERLPARALGAATGPGVLLGRMPPVLSVGSMSGTGPATDVARFLPAPFASRHDLLTAQSDHRRTAMGFVQVTGLDALLAKGTAADEVDVLTEVVEEACRHFDVTLLDTDFARDGFRYFVAAGTPRTVEDPGGRLLQALLDITSYDGPLEVRAGATVGEAFAGAVGSLFRRTFTVMGDSTNLAARLTARAPAGRVLAHAPVVGSSRLLFDVEEHDPVTVKGKADPLPVRVVRGVDGPRPDESTIPFVGRTAAVHNVLGQASGPGGALVEVADEAGMGKARFAQQVAARAALPTTRLAADPYGSTVPYRTLQQLLRPLLGIGEHDDLARAGATLAAYVERQLPELLPWLPVLAPAVGAEVAETRQSSELDDRFRVARLRDGVATLLAALLPGRRLVVLDGAQWVDPASAAVLGPLVAGVDRHSWTVLVTRRDVEGGLSTADAADAMRLGPLTEAEARTLVRSVPGREFRRAEVEALVRRSEGNPQFLVELATSGVTGELPSSVEQAVGIRIDELDGDSRDLLREAAVLGARFPGALLTDTTGRSLPALDGALGQFLAQDGDELAFLRDVYREVAYEQLSFRRRRDVHGRAAAAILRAPELVGTARLPMLSRHFHAAGMRGEAYRWSREAAGEARAGYANVEAAEFCRLALDAGRRGDVPAAELRDLAIILGDVLTLTGEHDEAIRAYATARRGLTDPAGVGRLWHKIGMVRRETNDLAGALRDAGKVRRQATVVGGAAGHELAAEADLLTAGVRYWQGRSKPAKAAAQSAARHAEQLAPGRQRTQLLARAYALHDSAVVELDGQAAAYGDEPLRMFHEIGDHYNEGRFSVNVAIGLFYSGAWERAVDLYRRSLELAQRIGDVFSVAVAQMNIGEVLAYQGHGDEAVTLLTESVESLAELHNPLAAAHASCFLGAALRVTGSYDEAELELDRAQALFAEAGVGPGFGLDEVGTRRLELLVDRGDGRLAAPVVEALSARGDALAGPHAARLHRSLALLALSAGDLDGARSEVELSLASGRAQALAYETALTLVVQAELPDQDRAACLAEAGSVFDALGVVGRDRVVPKVTGPTMTA